MSQRSKELRAATLKRDSYTCVTCGLVDKSGRLLEADHIVPLHKGGDDALGNMRTLCKSCHREATAPVRREAAGRLNARRAAWIRRHGKRPPEAPPGLV